MHFSPIYLPHSAWVSWRHLHITWWSPSTIIFKCQFRGNKGIYLAPLGIHTKASVEKVWRHNHHATNHYFASNFTVYLFLPPQSRTDLGHIPFSSCCARDFPLPCHAPIFSQIYPLGRLSRHVWQIARQLPMTLTRGGGPFWFHGGSLVVRYLP